jgi:flagellar biosynthesis protein FlhA
MAAPTANFAQWSELTRGAGVPLGLLALLAMIVLPLPPLMLDVLFTFNIAL